MTEESDRLLRFGVRTLPVSGQTKRSAMLVGGATFSYGSTNDGSSDPCRDSPGKISVLVQGNSITGLCFCLYLQKTQYTFTRNLF